MAQDKPKYTVEPIKMDTPNTAFMKDPDVDSLTALVVTLGSELWANRRRQLVVEKLLEDKGLLKQADIEAYEPSDHQKAIWDAKRDEFIKRTYAVLAREVTNTPNPNALKPKARSN